MTDTKSQPFSLDWKQSFFVGKAVRDLQHVILSSCQSESYSEALGLKYLSLNLNFLFEDHANFLKTVPYCAMYGLEILGLILFTKSYTALLVCKYSILILLLHEIKESLIVKLKNTAIIIMYGL